MFYNNLLCFLVAIFVFSASNPPEKPWLPPVAALALLLTSLWLFAGVARRMFAAATSSGRYFSAERRLSFVAVGLFELMKKLRVHPVQYLLVGAALTSFFLLLVSLSEHFSFGMSYALASGACVLLLGYYASHILGGLKMGLPFGAGIALLYGMLYVLLQLEQTALIVGSVALFLVLGAIMVATRKVNWYELTARNGATGKSGDFQPASGATS